MNKEAKEGYITVFLALSLGIILSLCLTLIEGARNNGSRMIGECAVENGLNSILAEYHREMLQQYGLFYIDISYGTNKADVDETLEHLRTYIQRNLSLEDKGDRQLYRDMFDLSVQGIFMNEISLASDEHGTVYRRQAEEYMKEKYGIGIIEDVGEMLKTVKTNHLNDESVTSRREEVNDRINEIDGSKVEVSEEEWVTVEVENPAEYMDSFRNSMILNQVMSDIATLSPKGFSAQGLPSVREKNRGVGVNAERYEEERETDILFFNEYLLDKFSHYGRELNKSQMKYQIEYMLEGKDSDIDNLEGVAVKLIAMREAANAAYLFTDELKRAQAGAMAATVSAVMTVPQLQALLEYAILFAWAYAESIYDVKALFAGKKVPLLKNANNWHTDIECILGTSGEEMLGQSEEGLTYKDYLRILLALEKTEIKTMRSLDMIEQDIRLTQGNGNFRIDACVDSLAADVNIISSFGYSFSIRRKCCYG